MLDPVTNFALVEVSTGYDDTATSIALSAGEGAKLPAPASDGEFNLVWWNSTDYANPADDPNVEIVRVTARSTDTLTVTRAQESTSGSTKNAGGKTYKMALTPTKKTIDDIDEFFGNIHVDVKKDFGATGDGSTVDSTAIQNAIDAVIALGGGVVYLPRGTYVVKNLFMDDNVTIAGAGMGVSILKLVDDASDGDVVLRASEAAATVSNIHGRDFTIDGNKAQYGSADTKTLYGLYLGAGADDTLSVFDTTWTRIEIKNCKTYAFDVVRCNRATFTDCWSHDNGFDTGTSNNCAGWEILSDNVTLINCIAEDNIGAAGFAFGQSSFVYEGAVFQGCIARGNIEGFFIRHNHYNVTCSSCIAYDNDAGFYIRNGNDTTLVGCQSFNNADYGVRTHQQDGLSVIGGVYKDNTTSLAGGVGEIELQSTTDNVVILGALFEPTSTQADYSIVVDSAVGSVSIIGCKLAAGDGGVVQVSNTQTMLRGNIGAPDQALTESPFPDTDLSATGEIEHVTVDTNATGFAACLYLGADGNYDESDADAEATMPVVAMAIDTGTGANKRVLKRGYIRDDSWAWTAGTYLYASGTTGSFTTNKPSATDSVVQIIGYAVSADVVYFDPQLVYVVNA